MSVDPPQARQMLQPETIMELQRSAEQVFVHNLVAEYAVRLVMATRTPADFHLPDLEPIIELGVSPRATLGLISSGRALALIHGRDYLLPSDIQTVALDVMGHRLGLTFDAVADNIDPRAVIERILATVPPPQPVWRDGNDGSGRPEFV
jgi:MoxR-like ATPase